MGADRTKNVPEATFFANIRFKILIQLFFEIWDRAGIQFSKRRALVQFVRAEGGLRPAAPRLPALQLVNNLFSV